MRTILLLLFVGAPCFLSAREALDKPNVILIFLDDCGYGDFSHTGNPSIHTPNVSRLVSEGLNFPQYYTATGACSASRYALLTGRNSRRSGFGWVIGPNAARYIHPDEITIAEGLRNRGYATAMYGKWHLGNPNSSNGFNSNTFPLAHGFDEWEGTNVSNDYGTGANLIRSNPAESNPIAGYEMIAADIDNNIAIQESFTERYRDRAIAFIQAHKDEPFFIYIAPNMPHLPVHASEPFKGQSRRGVYGDVIEEIDAMVGTIVRTLENEGIAENTLIHFTSDNGPWIRFENDGSRRFQIGSALPFRDGKGSSWEGGVRVPGVWYWPGTIQPATVERTPASTFDVLPTVFALAGEPIPADRALDGRDIRPFFNPTLFPGSVPDFEFIYTTGNAIRGARKGPWKLATGISSQTGNNYGFTASNADPLLFNVEQDPHERFDRSDEEPEQVTILQSLISEFDASIDSFW